jgi:hypothetical protein
VEFAKKSISDVSSGLGAVMLIAFLDLSLLLGQIVERY